jgi:hypothetical protein
MPNDKDEFYYFTMIDFKDAVEQWGDDFLSDLEKTFPEIYDRLEAYLANKQVAEFLNNQEEVL